MTTIAITGATGFIGCRAVAAALEEGHCVRALVHQASADELPRGVVGLTGDVLEADSLRELLSGCEFAIHLAGCAHSRVHATQRDRVHAVNVSGTRNFLEQAQRAGVRRVVVASSALVYGSGCDLPETATLSRAGDYAGSKAEVEDLVATISAPEVIVIRPSLVYGPRVRANLHSMLKALDRGYYFHVGRNSPMRSFAGVRTVARAMLHLLEHGRPGPYNVADEHPCLLESFANDLATRMQRPAPKHISHGLAAGIAGLLSAVSFTGIPVPLDRESLSKLVQPLWLNVDKLRATGFQWQAGDNECALQEMLESYLADSHTDQ